ESLAKTNIGNQPAQESVTLSQAPKLFDNPAGHDSEIPRITRNLHVTEFIDGIVAQFRDYSLQQCFALARAALCEDDSISLSQLSIHFNDQFRRILQVH